ncbi:MAG TPA: hypothetical protein VKB57_10475, partial [Acidimicrobiales bacterium]|nr:hypothetical protein [Acidimicrobiales bacterium]
PDDAEVAEAVIRALRAVADATVVPTAAPRPAPGTVISLTAARTGGRRRRVLAVAAALVVAGLLAVPWVMARAGGGGGVTIPAVPPPATTDPAAPQLVAGWLPADLADHGRSFGQVDVAGLKLAGAWMRSHDGGAEVLAATIAPRAGGAVAAHQADWIAQQLAAVYVAGDRGAATPALAEVRAGRGYVAVLRGDATRADARAVLDRMEAGMAPESASPGDWAAGAVPLGWVPGIAPTAGTAYAAGGRSLELSGVRADLPSLLTLTHLASDRSVLDPLPAPADRVGVRPLALAGGAVAWAWRPAGSQRDVVLWRAAPGVVGALVAGGLDDGELARIARGVVTSGRAAPAGSVTLADAGDDAWYAIERGPNGAGDEEPCYTLVLNGVAAASGCGAVDPGTPFVQMGMVARSDRHTIVFGVVGADVARATADDPGVRPAASLPLGPGGGRAVVLALPRDGARTVIVSLRDAAGRELDHIAFDPEGTLGG